MNTNQIYLSAPMNFPGNNYEEISLAKQKLQSLGFKVVTAHDLLDEIDKTGLDPKDLMRIRISGMVLCYQIVTLPNWDTDTDSATEVQIGRMITMDVTFIINFLQKNGANK